MRIGEYTANGLIYRDATREEEDEAKLNQEQSMVSGPTNEDRIEAQILYTALMTDTLLEEV